MAAAFAAGPGIAQAAPPSNDDFANAAPLAVGDQLLGTTLDATAEDTSGEQDVHSGHATADECNNAINDPRCTTSVWYTFGVASTGQYTLETCDLGTDMDTVIDVWTGTTLGALTTVVSDDDSCAGNDGGNGSRVTFTATSGTTYHVEVAGYAADQGMFYLRAYAGAARPSPPEPDTTISKQSSVRQDLVGGGTGSGARDNASFSFTSDEAGATFQCALDAAAFTACSSPVSLDLMGSHDFTVRSIVGGVPDPTPAVQRFTIDHTPPDTLITMHPPDPTSDATLTFQTHSTERNPDNQFSCSLDSTDATNDCESSPQYAGVCDGTHTFRVAAFDFAGNLDPSPASFSLTKTGGDPCADPEFGTLTSAQAGPTTENLGIPINVHGEPGTLKVEYGTTTAYGEHFEETVDPDRDNMSTSTGPLQPATHYHWHAVLTTPHGTVDSGDQEFTTDPVGGDHLPSISVGEPIVVGNHAAAIPVTANPGDQLADYGLAVSTDTTDISSRAIFGRDELTANSGPVSRVIDFVDLDPGTYHIRGFVAQQAGHNNQAQTADLTFTVPAVPKSGGSPPVTPPPASAVQKFKFRRGFIKVGKFGRHSKVITLVISHLPPSTSVGATVRATLAKHASVTKVKLLGRGKAKANKGGVARLKVKLSPKARGVLRSRLTRSLSLNVRVKPPGQSPSSITLHRRLKR